MSSEMLSHDEAISQFCGVTGADEERARGLLEACDWNLELAINMHVDTDPEGRSRKKEERDSIDQTSVGSYLKAHINHRADVAGMNDDDDDDINVVNSRLPSFGSQFDDFRRAAAAVGASSSTASASTSAHQTLDNDGVRPPIAPVRQILNPNPIGYPSVELPQRYSTRSARPSSDVYDAFRDFRAEAEWQEMTQEGNSNAVIDPADANGVVATGSRPKTTLHDLFRPPLDLMFRGSFTSSREAGSVKNKWMLVNIQNGREFACQTLNRDVWSNQTVKDIVKEHFIFWQVYHDSYEGQRYVHYYNVRRFPHVAIIDPRTGELMKSWPTTIDHNSFCDSVIEFLSEHPSPDGSGDANTMKKLRVKSDNEDDEEIEEVTAHPVRSTTLYDQSEEAQLEAAIKASLQETEAKSATNDDTIEIDEDTVEAFDTSDPQVIARDKELIERSPPAPSRVRFDKSRTKNNQNTPQHKQATTAPANFTKDNNSHSSQTTTCGELTPRTTAESLSAAMAERQPIKIDGPECKIALRFPDGSSLVQKFSSKERLSTVRSFVQIEKSTASASAIEFIAPPNRKLTEANMNETLEALGLCPASRLEVKCVQD